MRTEDQQNSPERREVSRELRRNRTLAEAMFWEMVRDRRLAGLKIRRQHPVGRFIADFYCPERKVAIELDGGVHKATRDRDAARDEAIRLYGVRVIRIGNSEIVETPELVVKRLRQVFGVSPSPSLTAMERGVPARRDGVRPKWLEKPKGKGAY